MQTYTVDLDKELLQLIHNVKAADTNSFGGISNADLIRIGQIAKIRKSWLKSLGYAKGNTVSYNGNIYLVSTVHYNPTTLELSGLSLIDCNGTILELGNYAITDVKKAVLK